MSDRPHGHGDALHAAFKQEVGSRIVKGLFLTTGRKQELSHTFFALRENVMNTCHVSRSVLVGIAALTGGAGVTSAALIVPVGSGSTADPGNQNVIFTGAFDAQPPSAPTVGAAPGYAFATSPQVYAGPRVGYLDFGAGYASITLTATYELLQKWGGTPSWAGLTWTWSDDQLVSTAGDNSAAPDFGFMKPTSVSLGSDNQWIQPWTGSVGVAKRYLLVTTPATGASGNASVEWVFVGTVPEPATMSLLGVGSLLLSRRRGQPV